MYSNESSLQIIKNEGFFVRIINFFRNMFVKDNTSSITLDNEIKKNIFNAPNPKNSSSEPNKKSTDDCKVKLLKIQNELERTGINRKNILELTKELSNEEKQMLESLYAEQIKDLEASVQYYKYRIMSMKKSK